MNSVFLRSQNSLSRYYLAVALCSALPLVAGCDDAASPAALLVAEETAPALRLSGELPTLPVLIAAVLETGASPALPTAQADRLRDALALWSDARDHADPTLRQARRSRAIALASPTLTQALGPERLDRFEARLQLWLELALSALSADAATALRPPLMAGRRLLAEAADARARDDRSAATAWLLEAAAAVEEVTPEAVATRLLVNGRAALAASSREAEPTRAERRAERLLLGAATALEDGDAELAIRRAYYADLLLRAR
ncbi:MAG: hypothetical protein ACRELD_15485 [Longimicrobiales bacterium]